jgi:ABC-type multidrug transport system fused ATPase/permease subunit
MHGSTTPPSTAQKLWHLLTPSQRRAAIVLLGLMLIGMVLETLGIGLVVPALALMRQSDLGARYPSLAPWLIRLGNPSHEQLVVAGMLVLVGVYAVKALFLSLLAWRQAHFVFGFQISLSQRLFAGYLRQPYTFHLQRNSAQLLRNAIGQVGEIVTVSGQGLLLVTETLVLLGISALLLSVEPLGAVLVFGTFGLAGWGFHRLTRRHILRWGEARQLHEGLRIQHFQQGLGGAKDVKLLGRESEFLALYQLHNVGSARVGERQYTVQALPRLFLELLAVTGLAALVLVMIGQGKPVETLVPTLGLLAAAAFRFMPSANRIIGAVQSVRYAVPVINSLYDELRLADAAPAPQHSEPLPFRSALTLDQVSFRYPSADALVLRGISLSIPRGASVGFIGASGAGKSTLVDVILGLLGPASGRVEVDGIDIQAHLRGWQDQIGYVPQSVYLTDDTLRRNVAFGLPDEKIDEAAVWRALHSAQLVEFVNDLPGGLDTVVGERGIRLSGGQRQRIGIARALYHDPPVLVLDEATSSVDTATERGIMDAVRALHGEKTILVVAHRTSTVEHCDRLFCLYRGRVVNEGEAAMVLAEVASSAD